MLENQKKIIEDNVHAVLAYSYASYFVSFLLGLLFHFLYPVQVYKHAAIVSYVGVGFLVLATILIFWAQKSSRKLEPARNASGITEAGGEKEITKEAFCRGPYCYTRMPTHWGLFFLMLGFGLVINSLFVALFTIAFFLFTKFFFIRKEEAILVSKYGKPYEEYKESVKL